MKNFLSSIEISGCENSRFVRAGESLINTAIALRFTPIATALLFAFGTVSGVVAQTPSGSFFNGDRYHVYLQAGQSITVTMTSTDVNAYLEIHESGTMTVLAQDDNSAGGNNARLTFTALTQGAYIIEATTFTTGQTGNYTIIIP